MSVGIKVHVVLSSCGRAGGDFPLSAPCSGVVPQPLVLASLLLPLLPPLLLWCVCTVCGQLLSWLSIRVSVKTDRSVDRLMRQWWTGRGFWQLSGGGGQVAQC